MRTTDRVKSPRRLIAALAGIAGSVMTLVAYAPWPSFALLSVTSPAMAADLAAGEKSFGKCKACHAADRDAKVKSGPNLWSVVGRPVASLAGYKYSKAMAAFAGQAWTPENIDRYLADPKGMAPGNKMAFNGLKDADERANLIAFLATRSDAPAAGDAASPAAEPSAQPADKGASAVAAAIPETLPPAIDPPPPSEETLAAIKARVAALTEALPALDYEAARHHPLHFAPAIAGASDEECLVCHQEIRDNGPRAVSPAGVKAADSLAWYQTLDTYQGDQQGFHWRHIESPFARQVMNLTCNFCHRGNDPREESPALEPNQPVFSQVDAATAPFTARKMVNPSTTCLLCHGAMPDPTAIMGLPGAWPEARADLESADAPNGCLTCHGELFRTNRHRVTYLKAASIEAAAAQSSDTCYGCHGGRAWYRISHPYPRHPWPGMDPAVPDWAIDRPTESDPAYRLPPTTK